MSRELSNEKFRNYFRLTRDEFQDVHRLVQPFITSEECNAQKPIGSEEKLSVVIVSLFNRLIQYNLSKSN